MLPTPEEAASLPGDIPHLWEEAAEDERRKVISPIVERVCVDMESRRIGAIAPVAGFCGLLASAMVTAESSAGMLLSGDNAGGLKAWSWWRQARGSSYAARYF